MRVSYTTIATILLCLLTSRAVAEPGRVSPQGEPPRTVLKIVK